MRKVLNGNDVRVCHMIWLPEDVQVRAHIFMRRGGFLCICRTSPCVLSLDEFFCGFGKVNYARGCDLTIIWVTYFR